MSETNRIARWRETFAGVLLGTAVGDALGLPAEGMSRQRIERRWAGQWRHHFFFGHGMTTASTSRSRCDRLARSSTHPCVDRAMVDSRYRDG